MFHEYNFLVTHQKRKKGGLKSWESFIDSCITYIGICIEENPLFLPSVSLAHKFSTFSFCSFSPEKKKENRRKFFSSIVGAKPVKTPLAAERTLKKNLLPEKHRRPYSLRRKSRNSNYVPPRTQVPETYIQGFCSPKPFVLGPL